MSANQTNGYWRSLNELENSPEFAEFLQREFPEAASEFPEGISRRRWLQLMGASLTLAGLAGCTWETEKIAAFKTRPEHRIPGEPEYFATSIELAGAPRHLLVTCFDGRPIKVEGNPQHPDKCGGTDMFAQAATLDLYDPDRSDSVRQRVSGGTSKKTWSDFDKTLQEPSSPWKQSGGKGLALLLQPTSSPAIHDQLERLRKIYPAAEIYEYAPLSRANELAGSEQAFGQRLRTHVALDRAALIACLDADLLGAHPAALKYARDYVEGRNPESGKMSRLYAIESQFSITGAAADHRLPLKSSQIGAFLAALNAEVQRLLSKDKAAAAAGAGFDEQADKFLKVLASDLVQNAGKSVVAIGPRQPAAVHALAHTLNATLGNTGKTIRYTLEPEPAAPRGELPALVKQMQAGEIQSLLILGGNPVYDAPADVPFAEALKNVETSIHLSVYDNETSRACQWHLPETHPFEAWGDVQAFDGTVGVAQPLIAPLLNGRSSLELLARVCGDAAPAPQHLVKAAVEKRRGAPLNDKDWRKTVHNGFLEGSGLPDVTPALRTSPAADEGKQPLAEASLELVFTASRSTFDGRFANNGWLQETPDFLTKLTWDNAALISPATAQELKIEHGTLIKLEASGRSLEIPAFVLAGQARGSIGLALGYGRTAAGHVGGSTEDGVAPVGCDVNRLRTWETFEIATDLKASPTGKKYQLATTQDHHAIDKIGLEGIAERLGELVREADLADFLKPKSDEHAEHGVEAPPLWKEHAYDGHRWGLSIDLTKCIGCSACAVACQAENNVPIVGKEQVAKGREMHWLRIDRYFQGAPDNPHVVAQPVACHHCEDAPCEQVCPVAATVHSDEGLNDMVYNRCIGTRYCANNCPYKVRRFNFFNNSKQLEQPGRQLVQLAVNPEVSVRARGVMEKCTYCVQRIQHGKIAARKAGPGREIQDGDILTACQQACPTRAIEFGDLKLADSRIAKAHANTRAYGMLAELNIKPRTKYLTRIRNLHPDLAGREEA